MSASNQLRARRPTTANIAAINDAVTINSEEAGVVTCIVDSVSAASGIVLTFEGQFSDNGPWVVLSSRATNGTNHATLLAATAAISALPAFGWAIPALGAQRVRARCTARTGGSLVARLVVSHQPL